MVENKATFCRVDLISSTEVEAYYEYLLNAFQEEFSGNSLREVYIDTKFVSPIFNKTQANFIRSIVVNAFQNKDPYRRGRSLFHFIPTHPLEIIDYIVNQGYPLSSAFLRWAYAYLEVRFDVGHWIRSIYRSVSPVDLMQIYEELKNLPPGKVPPTLELYYLIGTGTEKPYLPHDIGIREALRNTVSELGRFKDFNPVEYTNYYYSAISTEDLTVTINYYETLCAKRAYLPKNSTVLIVGNGPIPYEAFVWSMIPEIKTIVPADYDERNNEIMKQL
ncbi:MAG: hypothetical protein HYV41_01845 [Candidatus Magasanikbacteria bacterium]|nr:hypothetical protein [Candidatus Magasanikbacteria bacterium]